MCILLTAASAKPGSIFAMGHRVTNFEFRCWAACPNKSRSPSSSPSSSSSLGPFATTSKPESAAHRYEDMGLFSSRKQNDDTGYVLTATTSAGTDGKSVVQTIRSRFYGKKGKEREVDHLPYSASTTTSAKAPGPAINSILLPSSPPPPGNGIGASPRPSVSHQRTLLQISPNLDRPLPVTPSKSRTVEVVALLSSAASNRSRRGPSTPTKGGEPTILLSPTPTPQRKHTDSVTVTLAQRLNELAVANSEGLLTDDEYRLLRQSLFDRFASSSVVPQEESIVPPARPRPPKPNANPEGRPTSSRPLSNFQVEVPRPTSIHSRSSIAGMTDLLRRATGRRSSSVVTKEGDTSSILSGKSSSSKLFRFRSLSKKSSNSSINTTVSRSQADNISISSKRAGGTGSNRGHSDQGHPSVSSGIRSNSGSIRKLPPPSAFPTRVIGQDTRYATNIRDVFDEDNLKSAQDIQREIKAVEAEQRRLMDAFNGLELTTLSKARRHHNARPSPRSADSAKEAGPFDARSQRRFNPSESDALSIRSGTSIGTAPSVAPSIPRSAYSSRSRTLRGKGSHTLQASATLPSPVPLHRKNSSSSFASTDRRHERSQMVPPVPSLPATISYAHLRAVNNSSISLARSIGNTPMDVVHEDEDKPASALPDDGLEDEMEDIRRRREEVSLRYEARLDYLRAKLKGAQLHEKLLKK